MKIFFFLLLLIFPGLIAYAQKKYDFVVALDGSGNFTTIQAAVDACKAFPSFSVSIFIKNGIYKEKVVVPACNTHLRLIGESADKTILSWDDFFDKIDRGRNSTFYTYTLKVEADDFRAENITIQNFAGPVGQAVALHVEGSRCAFIHCRILGNQDTLYLAGENSRDYLADCYIEGTTDFIFGEATAFFENCTLYSKSNSYITAASTNEGKPYGFVFTKCELVAAPQVNKVYLGRPWRDYAKVVFLECKLGNHIAPEGWVNWPKTTRDKTAYYAEYNNTGAGAGILKRVGWSHQLSKKQAKAYRKEKVLVPDFQSAGPKVCIWATAKE
ncbi:MAG: pectinesterase family protein [Paludibacter sp.]|nr:pectinesterase family protein [Paludibacter sp.]